MDKKTRIQAEDGRQDLLITREFDLPLVLLFKAYTEAEIVEQWMGTKVLMLDNQRLGIYQFETTDPMGNKHGFSGVIHDFRPNEKITRTFEMEGSPFPVWLEYLEFEALDETSSRLNMHVVYKSAAWRDQLLQLPFAQGISMAHQRLQEIVNKLN